MGQDKALLRLDGQTLIHRVIDALTPVVTPILCVVSPTSDISDMPSHVLIVRDPVPHEGPLAGLVNGWNAMPTEIERAFVASCDAPFITVGWIKGMMNHLENHDAAWALVKGRKHPLSAAYHRRIVGPAEALMKAGKRRLLDLATVADVNEVTVRALRDMDQALGALANINTPQDYRRVLERNKPGPGEGSK